MTAQNPIIGSNLDAKASKGTLGKDDELLASLGYKQGLPTSFSPAPSTHDRQHTEFKRNFTPLEVFGIGFTIVGLVPSITYVLHRISSTIKLTKYKCAKLHPHIFDTIWRTIGNGLGSK